jgi:DNA-binding transcriptional LysR family regulator
MDFKDLRYFVAVYESRGFSRACDVLGTVQSNVSARIRNLEQSLGVSLFERRYRTVVPTHTADVLYEHAKRLIDTLEYTARVVRFSYAQRAAK